MAGLEGQTLGEFRILKRLGEGGMGQVYLAEQVRLERQVAIKVVRPPRPASGSGDESSPPMLADAPERFKREALAIGKLDHPNILPVHDFGMERELMYLVMPYLPEGSLFDAMRPNSPRRRFTLPLDAAQAAPLIFQAASALQYAHDRNIIHRDVKPENFLIRTGHDGSIQLLLADFGLVKEYHPGSASSTMAVGTADYVAPEQIEGRPVPASDQYALAVMVYELLTGRLPFMGSVAEVALKHMRDAPPALRRLNPKIPPEIEEVVLKALRKRPEERWPSVMEFARAYREALKLVEQRLAGEHPIEEEVTVQLFPSKQQAQQHAAQHPASPAQGTQQPPVQQPASAQGAGKPARATHPAQAAPQPPAGRPAGPASPGHAAPSRPDASPQAIPHSPPQLPAQYGYPGRPYAPNPQVAGHPAPYGQGSPDARAGKVAPPGQKGVSLPMKIGIALLVLILLVVGVMFLILGGRKRVPGRNAVPSEQTAALMPAYQPAPSRSWLLAVSGAPGVLVVVPAASRSAGFQPANWWVSGDDGATQDTTF